MLHDFESKDTMKLRAILRILIEEGVGDFVYEIRERELKGWDGPRVTQWGNMVLDIKAFMKKYDIKLGEK